MARREIRFYKQYFAKFYAGLPENAKRKISQVLVWVQTLDYLPISILKAIEGQKGLFEIRVVCNGNIYRIFCCFDKDCIIILFNGFQKKSQKTPPSEIKKAIKLLKEYQKSKN